MSKSIELDLLEYMILKNIEHNTIWFIGFAGG